MPSDGNQERGGYRSFGAYVRSQRQLAQLTLRQLAELSSISNPYLSQIERGLHQPSVAVIRAIADALNLSADALLAQVAGLDGNDPASASVTTESAIRADPQLTGAQKSALLSVYRTMVGHPDEAGDDTGSQLPAAGRRSASTPDIASEPAADADAAHFHPAFAVRSAVLVPKPDPQQGEGDSRSVRACRE